MWQERLILDLSILKLFVRKCKVKFEDWNLIVEYFQENCYMFIFDLKSGYFHADIFTKPNVHVNLTFIIILCCRLD